MLGLPPVVSAFARPVFSVFFFFNDTATTEIYTLSLHDALPICEQALRRGRDRGGGGAPGRHVSGRAAVRPRSEEHTSELQSLAYLVCRLLLEKKKKSIRRIEPPHDIPAGLIYHTGCAHHRRRPR